MTKIKYLTKEGFRNLKVNKMMTVASITVLFSCLLLVGIAFMILVNIESFIENIEDENVIMVYMDDTKINAEDNQGYTQDDYERDYQVLGGKIREISYVDNDNTVEVRKESAYEEILADLDENVKTYLQGLDENPIPDAYKVTVSDMGHFDEVVTKIKALPNVLRVHENSTLARQLNSMKNTVQYISIAVIALLLLVSLFIIANTIKVTMFSRRLEISIMKSVGATNSFIRWPFMVEGMIIGIFAGAFATGAVWGLYELAMDKLMSFFSIFGDLEAVPFATYAPYLALIFIAIGVFTGVFGSSTSIRKYLRERKFVELED